MGSTVYNTMIPRQRATPKRRLMASPVLFYDLNNRRPAMLISSLLCYEVIQRERRVARALVASIRTSASAD